MWVTSVVVVVLVNCGLGWVAVGWQYWVSWLVEGVPFKLELSVCVVG